MHLLQVDLLGCASVTGGSVGMDLSGMDMLGMNVLGMDMLGCATVTGGSVRVCICYR